MKRKGVELLLGQSQISCGNSADKENKLLLETTMQRFDFYSACIQLSTIISARKRSNYLYTKKLADSTWMAKNN